MILHSKIYFMRAPARQRKYRIKELYRQTEGTPEGVPFVISTAERERRETPPSTLVNQCRPLLGRVGAPGPTGVVQTNRADQGSGVMRSGGELRQSRKRSHSGVSRPTGAVQTNRADPSHLSDPRHLPRTVMRGKTREAKGEPTPNGGSAPMIVTRS